jgi:protein gp37
MGSESTIEWTEATWNPTLGCTPVSPGCDLCYAGVMSHRLALMGRSEYVELTVKRNAPGRAGGSVRATFTGVVRCLPERLSLPTKWKKPKMIFVNSMSDLFHKEVPIEFIQSVFDVMVSCPQHTFQLLTKRPERAAELAHCLPWPSNVWLGTSAENQATLDERVPSLIRCPATVRFLSCEPLLGPIDLSQYLPDLHWVIFGAESGHGARNCPTEWVRSGVLACQSANVATFVKQLSSGVRGRVSKNPEEWAEDLRVRQFPTAVRTESLSDSKA